MIDINLTDVASETDLNNHVLDTANPHDVTKTQVGLGNVDNTSDVDKPISSATQTALNAKENNLPSMVGNSLKVLRVNAGGTAKEWATISSGGIFGISNSSGIYTYYSTLTLAMASATSGQTIEMFADVVETTNIAIALKDGVNINGNGHTYTLNQSGTANTIQDGGVAVNCAISNITFKRIGGTGADTNTICMYITGASRLKLKSTNLITASNMRCLVVNNVSAEIFNVYCEGHNPVAQLLSGTIYDSEFRSLGGSGLNVLGTNAKAYKCTSYGSGAQGIYMTAGELTDCFGYSPQVGGIDCYGGSMRNCVGYGGGGPGLTTNNSSVIAIDCVGYGIGGVGIHGSSAYMLRCAGYSSVSYGISNVNGILYDCLGYSTVNSGIYSWNSGASITEVRSCKAISLAAIALFLDNTTSGCKIYNTEAYSKWNNALGHGIKVMGNNAEIVQCVIEVTNASANAINSASAFTTKYANNAFKGSTTPINANITQGMVNIHDLQGNILI